MMRFAVMALACCAVLAGCASPEERAEGRTPAFHDGYDDGCAAASTTGVNPREAPYRDDAMYKASHAYRAGWSSGFASCRNTGGNAAPQSPLDNRVLNPSPGH